MKLPTYFRVVMILRCGDIYDPRYEGPWSEAVSYGTKSEDHLMVEINKWECNHWRLIDVGEIADAKAVLRGSDISSPSLV